MKLADNGLVSSNGVGGILLMALALTPACKDKSSAPAPVSSSAASMASAPPPASSHPSTGPHCSASIVPVWHLEKTSGENLYSRDRSALQAEPKLLTVSTGFFLCEAAGDGLAPLFGCRAKGKAGNGSQFISADESCEGKGVSQGILGYAAMTATAGTKPLLLLVNAKTGDHFYTPNPDAAALHRQGGYTEQPFFAAFVWMQPS